MEKPPVTGVILAGGKSRRFGENKALSVFDGENLIERLIRTLGKVTDQMVLVTNTPETFAYLELPMVTDIVPECGSLGGIYTGLKTMRSRIGVFLACDMPFVDPAFLRYMIEKSEGPYDVVVPRSDNGLEPLCAVYSESCLEPVEKRVLSRDLKVIKFYDEVRVEMVTQEDTSLFTPHMLFNVNTRSDYEDALQKMGTENLK